MDLEAAAALLGVHYQTAYRLVRTGVLPAVKVGLGYELDPEKVEALRRRRWARVTPVTNPNVDWSAQQAEFAYSLLHGAAAAREQIQRLQDEGVTVLSLCDELIAPAIRRLDEDFAAGAVLGAEVLEAINLSERLVGTIAAPLRGRPRGLAVVASPSTERHRLPSLMATAVLRGSRWRVQHLGSGVPAGDLVEFVEETQPDLVVLSVTVWDEAAEEFCASVSGHTSVPIVAGGSGEPLTELLERVEETMAVKRSRAVSPGLLDDPGLDDVLAELSSRANPFRG